MNRNNSEGATDSGIPAYLADKDFHKAVKGRLEEFVKFKRDIQSRYTEAQGMSGTRIAKMKLQLTELERVQQLTEQTLHDISALDHDSWPEEKLTGELAQAMKKLDNFRLELIRQSARLDEIFSSEKGEDKKGDKGSAVLDIMSLSFGQLLRLGLIVSLPLVMILSLGLAVLAVAVYFSTRI